MSLLIKGVEMPDSCLNCRFRTTILKNVLSPTMRTSAYACLISGMEINNWYEEKHKNCPLVEIPTPHGDLVDRDDLIDEINRVTFVKRYDYDVAYNIVTDAETIIEAEVSE